jgi:Raf kinase inhibitor-like YbhB/YbcL family protein
MENLNVLVDYERFPAKNTCDGQDLSPRIKIPDLNAPYIAIIMDDPDSSSGFFTHWLAWNIPATNQIPEGIPPHGRISQPIAAVQGKNDYGTLGYRGPCPPKGESHRYFIRVWGVKTEIELPPGASRGKLEAALEATASQYGEVMVLYAREKVRATTYRI